VQWPQEGYDFYRDDCNDASIVPDCADCVGGAVCV